MRKYLLSIKPQRFLLPNVNDTARQHPAQIRRIAFTIALLMLGIFSGSKLQAYTVSGTTIEAPNGLPLSSGNTFNGTPVSSVLGLQLYVYIINQSGIILNRAQVNGNGTYSITGVVAGQAGAVQLSANSYNIGGKVLFIGLPSDYYAVGEGDMPAGDQNPDYSFALAQTNNIVVNFGFEQRPGSNNATISTYTYDSYHRLIIPAAAFNGADPEDGPYLNNLAGRTIDFYPATPSATTSIYYYDTLLNFTSASSKITIDSFNPNKVTLGISGNISSRSFSYAVADAAGARPYVPTTITTSTPLLISLAAFGAAWQDESAIIRWTTASEKVNSYFIVERSTDGATFSNIGKIASQATNGNSASLLSYSYTDNQIKTGTTNIYYRLRSVDNNGTGTVSKTIHLQAENTAQANENGWSLYPNPATDFISIQSKKQPEDVTTVTLLNVTGAMILNSQMPAAQALGTINVSGLPSGMYLLKISNGNTSMTKQVTVQH